jgi:DNA-binding helix-hairpin-helix protein with protein kinase domain
MLVDQNGVPVRLGRQIGRTGGEGNVYSVDSHAGAVAKIYHRLPVENKVAKLRYLARRSTPELKKCAAWPLLTISDERGQPRGFLMPAVSGKEIHHLFGTRDRVVDFPGKNWDFLINTARNSAVAFDIVHATGAVIGDVNEGNVLVQANGFIALIDCDSYQISNGTTSWTCDVGVDMWTPPELQGQNFRGLVRTTNHDLFGLALLIFKLLFMGRHPYAGVPLDGADNLLEDAIRKRLYAYSPLANTYGVRAPQFTFPVASLPEPYGPMFEMAFRLNVPRPTAKDWVQALDLLHQTVIRCSRDTSHSYPKFLSRCPWCEIAAAGGPLFFVSIDVVRIGPLGDDAAVIWAAISRIQCLRLLPKMAKDFSVPAVSPAPLPANAQGTRPVFVCGLVLYAIALLLLLAGAIFPALITAVFATGMVCEGRGTPEFVGEKKRRQAAVAQVERDITSTSAQLDDLVKKYKAEFEAKVSELKQAYQRYSGLERERQTEMQRLERDKQQLQLNDFLRGQLISRAKIPGIGDVRKHRLLSFGIGSALDLRRNLRIPGFGPTNMSHLLNWRATCEARFRFEPNQPIPPIEIQRLNLKIATLRTDLSSTLQAGPNTLTSLSAGAQGRYLQLTGQLEIAVRRRAQAQVDYRLCR